MYIILNSTDLSEIGVYPNSKGLVKGYNYNVTDSIMAINYDEINTFIPNLKSFELKHKAKLTDYIDTGAEAILISPKLLDILLSHNLPKYQYFEADVMLRNKHYTYYYFFIIGQYYEWVDYEKMSFWGESEAPYNSFLGTLDLNKIITKEVKVKSPEQLINWKKLYPTYPNRRQKRIILNISNIQHDLIKTPRLLGGYYFVSNELKKTIEAAACTGLRLSEQDVFGKTFMP